MSPELTRYRELEEALREVRRHNEPGSRLEDPIIAECAELWWKLTDAERDMLDAEGPTCFPEMDPTGAFFKALGKIGPISEIKNLSLYPEEKKKEE